MYSDKSLNDKDKDKLNRYHFAKEIAKGLVKSFKNTNDSIVVGINGDWGSGKSTLINFLMEEIKRLSELEEEKIITLQFNPWMFSGQRELQNVFFKELFLKLEGNKEKLKGASEKVSELLGYFNWLKYLHSGAGEVISDTQEFLDNFKGDKDILDKKKDLDDLLIKSGVRIYITIDDIDRLTPNEITEILQLVKLNANFANTTFILAYDLGIVSNALNHKYGENGKKYLEKIIQIDYTLPQVPKQGLKDIFFNSLLESFSDEELVVVKENEEEILSSGILECFKTIRDIYRFVNSIRIRFSSIYKELNIKEFFIVESLRIFDHEAYKFVLENKSKLLINRSRNRFTDEGHSDKEVSEFIENSNLDSLAKKLIKKLFVIETAVFYSSVSKEELIKARRISSKGYFDRYFILQLTNTDIPESTFLEFIESDSLEKRLDILNDIKNEQKLFQFLNWLKMKGEGVGSYKISRMVTACLEFAKKMSYSKAHPYFGSISELDLLIKFSSDIISEIREMDHRRKLFLDYISNNKDSFVSLYLTDTILYIGRRVKEGKSIYNYGLSSLFEVNYTENDYEVNKDFIDKVEKENCCISKELFNKVTKENKSYEDEELIMIFWGMSKCFNEEFVAGVYSFIKEDSKKLIKYVWLCMKKHSLISSCSSGGTKTGYGFSKSNFHEGIDSNKILSMMDVIKEESLDENEKLILSIFRRAKEDGFNKDWYYNIETLEVMDRS